MSKRGIEEEQWDDKNEIYMRDMIKICKNRSAQHETTAYTFKSKNVQWGLSLVLLPVVMSPVSVLIDDFPNASKYLNAFAFLATGVIGGVVSFFKYGEKMSNHFNYAARYGDIVTDIQAELVKGRSFRIQLDVFSTKIKMLIDNLLLNEPTIPKNIIDNPKYAMPSIDYHIIRQNDVVLDSGMMV
jgi:hypothetical protein